MLHARLRAAAGAEWTPERLFSGGAAGAWFEAHPDYLFQDAAATTPVTSDGDRVGYMQDLSGNGHHATQTSSTLRPTYRTSGGLHWLEFNGSSHHMSVAADSSLRQSIMSIFLSYWSSSSSRQDIVSNGNVSAFSSNNWTIGADNNFQVIPRTPSSFQEVASSALSATHVSTTIADGADVSARVDAGSYSARSSTFGTDNTEGLFIGASYTTGFGRHLSGRVFGLIIVGGEAEPQPVIIKSEQYLAELSGASL